MIQEELLKKEKKEHDRNLVAYYEKRARQCEEAWLHYPDNDLIRAAWDLSRKKAARAFEKFVRKYGEPPLESVQIVEVF